MTPEELSDAINAATTEEFGPGPWDSEKFPQAYFNYSVFAVAPNGAQTQRAPEDCATMLGASQLASLFIGQSEPHQVLRYRPRGSYGLYGAIVGMVGYAARSLA